MRRLRLERGFAEVVMHVPSKWRKWGAVLVTELPLLFKCHWHLVGGGFILCFLHLLKDVHREENYVVIWFEICCAFM